MGQCICSTICTTFVSLVKYLSASEIQLCFSLGKFDLTLQAINLLKKSHDSFLIN